MVRFYTRRASRLGAALVAVLLLAVSVGATVDAAALHSSASTALSGKLTLFVDGDTNVQQLWQGTVIPGFEKLYPKVKVNLVYSAHGAADSSVTDKISQSKATGQNPGFDLLDSGIVTQAATGGLLAKITNKEVPRASELTGQEFQPVDHAALPYRGSKVLIAVNTADVKKPPTTLSGLISWIKAHPGKFSYNNPTGGGAGQGFIEAVVNSYLSADTLKKMQLGYDPSLESQWNPGFAELKSLAPDLYQNGAYPTSQDQVYQLLASGAIWACPSWSDQGLSNLKTGEWPSTVKLMELNPPMSGGPAYLGVPVNSPNKKLAFAMMNFILSPKEQANIVNAIQGTPAIPLSQMPKSVQRELKSIGSQYSEGYSSQTSSDLNRLWQSQVAAG